MKSKKFVVLSEWDDGYDEEGNISSQEQLVEAILNDEELATLEEIVFGYWGECYETSPEPFIEMLAKHKEKFQHIKSLYFGDMEQEECEISWIEHCNYETLWSALPNLEKLVIKGATKLELGEFKHDNLKHFEIISGGISVDVLNSITNAKLPKLETLVLYLGVEDYGFDGTIEDIKSLVDNVKSFGNLKHLGLLNSEIQNHIAMVVVDSGIVEKLEVLDLSCGVLVDVGGQYLLDNKDKLANLKELNLDNSYFSEAMTKKLANIGINVSLEDIEFTEYTDDEINSFFTDSDYDYWKETYERLLTTYNLEKIEIENKSVKEIECEVLAIAMTFGYDTYPLYTE